MDCTGRKTAEEAFGRWGSQSVIEDKTEGSCSLSKEWLGPPLQTFRKLRIAVLVIFEVNVVREGLADWLIVFE